MFSMLAKTAKGKLTLWGEIDRQHILPEKNVQPVKDAVRKVIKHFYNPKPGLKRRFQN